MGSQTGSSLPAKFPTKRKEHHRRSTKQSPGYYYQLVAQGAEPVAFGQDAFQKSDRSKFPQSSSSKAIKPNCKGSPYRTKESKPSNQAGTALATWLQGEITRQFNMTPKAQ
jgi:hypothetical protein